MPAPISPHEARQRLLDRLEPIAADPCALEHAAERVLAEPVVLDRDSPACDVSAMDGFAVRAAELTAGKLPIVGECQIGKPPSELATNTALRIYTGSPRPSGADTVVRLEWVEENSGTITLKPEKQLTVGGDIRRQGENAKSGDRVLEQGLRLTAPAIAAAATVGCTQLSVHRRLRVAIITTGAELEPAGSKNLPAWRLRDSNGPSLVAMLRPAPWIESVEHVHADDSLPAITAAIGSALETADAVALTGGVSKGAYDFVPDAVQHAGGEILFHRIKARPGQPTLGAIAAGKPIIGLPGNPLAVLTAGRRLFVPVLRKLAGVANPDPPVPTVMLENWQGKTLPLTWWRPVNLTDLGTAQLTSLRGSGDVCGPAATDGFIEVPPESNHTGPYAFYDWQP